MWGGTQMEAETNGWGDGADTGNAWGDTSGGGAQTENAWGQAPTQDENSAPKPKGKGGRRGGKGEEPESPPHEKYRPTVSAGWFKYKKDRRTPLSTMLPENAEVIEIVDDDPIVIDDSNVSTKSPQFTSSTTLNVDFNLHYFTPSSLQAVPVKYFQTQFPCAVETFEASVRTPVFCFAKQSLDLIRDHANKFQASLEHPELGSVVEQLLSKGAVLHYQSHVAADLYLCHRNQIEVEFTEAQSSSQAVLVVLIKKDNVICV